MPFVEKFDGRTLQEIAWALAQDDSSPMGAYAETRFERAVRSENLSPESAVRVIEAIEAAGEEELDRVDYVVAHDRDDLESGGALVGGHRYIVRLLADTKPHRMRGAKKMVQSSAPAMTGPRIVRAAEKKPVEAPVVEEKRRALGSDDVARFLGSAASRPKPRGRFVSSGQIEGFRPSSPRPANFDPFAPKPSAPRRDSPASSARAAAATPPRSFEPKPVKPYKGR